MIAPKARKKKQQTRSGDALQRIETAAGDFKQDQLFAGLSARAPKGRQSAGAWAPSGLPAESKICS